MKKQNLQIKIYRRNAFGFLVKVACFDKREHNAVISTSGVLRISHFSASERAPSIVAAYAAGEWHICDCFTADYQSKNN